MTQSKPTKKSTLTFIWQIENYSTVCERGEAISSPEFEAKMLDNTLWSLELRPTYQSIGAKGSSSLGSVYVRRAAASPGPEVITVSTSISCESVNGEISLVKETYDEKFTKGSSLTCHLGGFEPWELSDFTPDNKLTVWLQLWKEDCDSSEEAKYFVRSRFDTIRILQTWNIDLSLDLSSKKQQTLYLHSGFPGEPYLEMSGFTAKKSGYFHIEIITNKTYFLSGKIFMLDQDGKPGKPSLNIRQYLVSNNVYNFPKFIHKNAILFKKLSLMCDFVIFTGKTHHVIEEVNYIQLECQKSVEYNRATCEYETFPTLCRCFCDRGMQTCEAEKDKDQISNSPSVPVVDTLSRKQLVNLRDDVLSLYTQKKFCDLRLRAKGQLFPVHKTVLCARSQRFRDMFEDPLAKVEDALEENEPIKCVQEDRKTKTSDFDGHNAKEKDILCDAKMEEWFTFGNNETKRSFEYFRQPCVGFQFNNNASNKNEPMKRDEEETKTSICVGQDTKPKEKLWDKKIEKGFSLGENETKKNFEFSKPLVGFTFTESEKWCLREEENIKEISEVTDKEISLEKEVELKLSDNDNENTDFLDVTDVDPETLSLLLDFMYSDVIEDISAERATSLYLASMKYDVISLKEKCLSFVESNLSETNVCAVLAL